MRRDPAQRRLLRLLLVLLVGVALAIWWAWGEVSPGNGDAIVRKPTAPFVPADLRRAPTPDEDPPPVARPELVGRGEAPAPSTALGPVHVRVLGPGGEPLSSVAVTIGGTAPPDPLLRTNEAGELTIGDLPQDGRASLAFQGPSGRRLPRWDGGGHKLVVRGPDVTYVAATGFRLEIEVVDAESGRPRPDAQTTVESTGLLPKAARLGPHSFLVFPPLGTRAQLEFTVEAPRDRIAWEPTKATFRVSPYAKELYLRHPLRRARRVMVVVQHADGSPAEARIRKVRAAHRTVPPEQIEADAYGRFHLGGIPHLPGEPLTVGAATTDPGLRGAARLAVLLPDDPRERLDLVVRLPKLERLPLPGQFEYTSMVIGLGGGVGVGWRGRHGVGHHRLLAAPGGQVDVTVRHHDGRPARNAWVTVGTSGARTDEHGRARVSHLPSGTHRVAVRQHGLLPMTGSVKVSGPGTFPVELREPEGATLQVEVVDGSDRALPFATLEIETPSGHPWVDLEAGRQRLDPFTDHRGRRTLHHVESGALEVTARWATRKKKVRIVLRDGRTERLRVSLPRSPVLYDE